MNVDKKFQEYLKKEMDSKEITKTKMVLIHLIGGENVKAKEILDSMTNYEMPQNKYNVTGISIDE